MPGRLRSLPPRIRVSTLSCAFNGRSDSRDRVSSNCAVHVSSRCSNERVAHSSSTPSDASLGDSRLGRASRTPLLGPASGPPGLLSRTPGWVSARAVKVKSVAARLAVIVKATSQSTVSRYSSPPSSMVRSNLCSRRTSRATLRCCSSSRLQLGVCEVASATTALMPMTSLASQVFFASGRVELGVVLMALAPG